MNLRRAVNLEEEYEVVTGSWGSDNTASCNDLKVTVESEVSLLLIYCIPKEIHRWIEVQKKNKKGFKLGRPT